MSGLHGQTWEDVCRAVEGAQGEAAAQGDSQGGHDLVTAIAGREQQRPQLQQQQVPAGQAASEMMPTVFVSVLSPCENMARLASTGPMPGTIKAAAAGRLASTQSHFRSSIKQLQYQKKVQEAF